MVETVDFFMELFDHYQSQLDASPMSGGRCAVRGWEARRFTVKQRDHCCDRPPRGEEVLLNLKIINRQKM